MHALVGPLEAGRHGALADGFVTSAAVLRHLQSDPLLPPSLLPDRWPGDTLRADYDRFDAAYRSVLRAWFAAATSDS
jgi:phenylacetic acid degradation operon negative regulatory protein